MDTYKINYNRIKELCEIFKYDYEYYTIYVCDKSLGPIMTNLCDFMKECIEPMISNTIPKVYFHNKFDYVTDKQKIVFEIGEKIEWVKQEKSLHQSI